MEREMSEASSVASFSHAGMTLVAEAQGTGETVFVLVHGIGMGRSVFLDAARHLLRGGRVVAVDLPGYGEAPEPARTPTIERMADLVAAYLVDRVPGRVVLVGHSMGTQVVAEVVSRHPGLASHVVLAAPTVDIRHRTATAQLGRLGLDLLHESPRVIIAGAREYLRAGPHVRRKYRAMLRHQPEHAYPRVDIPALVLRGARDPVSPREWCAFVVAALPQAVLEEIPERGHETMIRDAEPAAARILSFVFPDRSASAGDVGAPA